MRSLLSIAILFLIAAPVFADTSPDFSTIPEPSVIALIGIGALALLVGRRNKK